LDKILSHAGLDKILSHAGLDKILSIMKCILEHQEFQPPAILDISSKYCTFSDFLQCFLRTGYQDREGSIALQNFLFYFIFKLFSGFAFLIFKGVFDQQDAGLIMQKWNLDPISETFGIVTPGFQLEIKFKLRPSSVSLVTSYIAESLTLTSRTIYITREPTML